MRGYEKVVSLIRGQRFNHDLVKPLIDPPSQPSVLLTIFEMLYGGQYVISILIKFVTYFCSVHSAIISILITMQ